MSKQINENIPLVREYKNDDITVLIISYKFTDKSINGTGLGPKIKNYYEQNSRNKVTIKPSYFTAVFNKPFGYTAENVASATRQANAKFGSKKFKFYVHVCNPVKSTAGGNICKTFNSSTNAIHEFGHLLSFGHSNKMDYSDKKPKVLYQRDPFDAIQMFATYPSLSPSHLYNHGWYSLGEIVYAKDTNIYDLYLLRDFSTSGVIKTLGYHKNDRLYFISYGWKPSKKTKEPEYFLIIHYTDSGYNYSFLEACFKLNKTEQTFEHQRTGFTFKILKWDQKYIQLQTFGNSDPKESNDKRVKLDNVEDIEYEVEDESIGHDNIVRDYDSDS